MSTDLSKESQVKQILAWLRSGKEITPMDALNEFGCFRLAARIKDLENQGYTIHRELVRNGDKKYNKYWIPRETSI